MLYYFLRDPKKVYLFVRGDRRLTRYTFYSGENHLTAGKVYLYELEITIDNLILNKRQYRLGVLIFMPRIPMDSKELREARRIGLPGSIIGKLTLGIEPTDGEKGIIKKLGKVYVEAHKKNGKWVKPQLRDLPGGTIKIIVSGGLVENVENLPRDWGYEVEDLDLGKWG